MERPSPASSWSKTGSDPPSLALMHATHRRLRLRYAKDLPSESLGPLLAELPLQSWVGELQHRPSSRSLVIALATDGSGLSWQLDLAAMGWRLEDGSDALTLAASDDARWREAVRLKGASMMGAVLGQLVLGGIGAALGGWWLGARGALLLGGSGALLGSVSGALIGADLVKGENPLSQGDLGEKTMQRLGVQLGEEAGSSTGMVIGTALAGPVGAVAGTALGSMVAGQLSKDLISSHGGRVAPVGSQARLVSLGVNNAGERLNQEIMAQLGRALMGGSEAGTAVVPTQSTPIAD